jgi:short-subunit dehydrogenase
LKTGADFASRYGPWAVVAGASEGLGAAFARQLAGRGLHVVLVARRPGPLESLALEISQEHGVDTRTVALDLAAAHAAAGLQQEVRDLDVGLLVYNAALSPLGGFLDQDLETQLAAIDLNCRTPLALAHGIGRRLVTRGRGGILLMSSLSGLQGSALMATYAATKAFGLVLGEGLWEELRRAGVDVLAFCAGATRTPNYEASQPGATSRLAPAVMEPEAVAREALAALGRRPSGIAGRGNRVASFVMGRLLPRQLAVRIMGRAARDLYER